MDLIIGAICLALAVAGLLGQLWIQIAWGRRDSFWRHHDHLIPSQPRSARSAP